MSVIAQEKRIHPARPSSFHSSKSKKMRNLQRRQQSSNSPKTNKNSPDNGSEHQNIVNKRISWPFTQGQLIKHNYKDRLSWQITAGSTVIAGQEIRFCLPTVRVCLVLVGLGYRLGSFGVDWTVEASYPISRFCVSSRFLFELDFKKARILH